jgi:plasmid stabilization system protein ParE
LKAWRLVFSRRALADLDAIYDWIAENAGPKTAERYTDRLRAFGLRLTHYPMRAEVRDYILPGVRLIGFEKSVTLAFIVDDAREEVRILRLLYRGQQIEI